MRKALAVLVVFVARAATASEKGPANGADLTHAPAFDSAHDEALEKAKHVRLAGVAMTLAGLAGVVSGGVGFYAVNSDGHGAENNNGFSSAATVTIGGSALFGAGVGLAITGGYEVGALRRGAAPLAHARAFRNSGIVLTTLGAALSTAALGLSIWGAIPCGDCGDVGDLPALFGMIMGGSAGVLLGAGTALLGVGVLEDRRGKPHILVDSIAPRAMPNGAGFGIGGRF